MILHTADWHLHDHKAFARIVEPNMNSRLKEQLTTLCEMAVFVQENRQNIEAMVIEGDVYGGLGKHERDKIDKDVLNAGYQMIKVFAKSVPVIVIPGNHDLHKGTTILKVLQDIPNLRLVTEPAMIRLSPADHYFVPYPPGHQQDQAKWFEWVRDGGHWLVTHMAFQGAEMENFIDEEAVPIPNVPFIITGHYHVHKMVRNVLYVGPPYQMAFSDEGRVTGFVTFEKAGDGRWGFKHIRLPGPQFVTININKQEELDAWFNNRLDNCYYRLLCRNHSINIDRSMVNSRTVVHTIAEDVIDLPGTGELGSFDIEADMKDWCAALPVESDKDKVLALGREIWKEVS